MSLEDQTTLKKLTIPLSPKKPSSDEMEKNLDKEEKKLKGKGNRDE